MPSLFLVIVTAALINNVVLSQFYGLCSFLGVSQDIKTASSMGFAVVFVITIASGVANLLYTYILAPLNLAYLQTIVFIVVIACLVQVVEMFLKKNSPAIYKSLGVFLPLITTNCAVLGVALSNVQSEYNFIYSVVCGFATAVGYLLAIVILAGIRLRISKNDVPAPFQGAPVVLLASALMAIAFYGFSVLS